MNKSIETRKIIKDFLEFGNAISVLENETEYFYWMTESILKAADAIKEIEKKEQ